MSILLVELRTCRTLFALGDCGLFHCDDCFYFWIITVNQIFVTRYDARDKDKIWVLVRLFS
jgi:hypothetical protein